MAKIEPFVSLSQLPPFNRSERFNLFYLEATLSLLRDPLKDKDHLIQPNVFHTALGIQAIHSNVEFAFDYDANSFLGSFLPLEMELNQGNLAWNNGSVVNINSFIQRDYWEHSHFVCTISMHELEELAAYMISWYRFNPYYVFFAAVNEATPSGFFNTPFRNSICDTFVNDCILFLQNNGVPIKFITPLPTSVGALVTGRHMPVRLNPDDAGDKARIIRFYRMIYHILNALTPKTKAALAGPMSTTRPMNLESPEVRQRAMAQLMQLVQGHVILYTYVPGTMSDLGYFLLKLEPPFIYADYIVYTPIMQTEIALDTDYTPVPE